MGGRYRGEEEVRLNGQHLGGAWGYGYMPSSGIARSYGSFISKSKTPKKSP